MSLLYNTFDFTTLRPTINGKIRQDFMLIAHRGNIQGRRPEVENHPEYVYNATTALGEKEPKLYVEVDLWYYKNNFFLGHDEPQWLVADQWLGADGKFIFHCKNMAALEQLVSRKSGIDSYCYFYHENDAVTLTSQKHLWIHPNADDPLPSALWEKRKSILAMPEIRYAQHIKRLKETDKKEEFISIVREIRTDLAVLGGICTDYPATFYKTGKFWENDEPELPLDEPDDERNPSSQFEP